jgi:hypothetical protein
MATITLTAEQAAYISDTLAPNGRPTVELFDGQFEEMAVVTLTIEQVNRLRALSEDSDGLVDDAEMMWIGDTEVGKVIL